MCFFSCVYLEQIYIDVDPSKPFIVAVVVCHLKPFQKWLEIQSKDTHFVSFSQHPMLEDFQVEILRDLQRIGKENNLHFFEIPAAVIVSDVSFSFQNDLLNSSLKLNRKNIKKKFSDLIDKIVTKIGQKFDEIHLKNIPENVTFGELGIDSLTTGIGLFSLYFIVRLSKEIKAEYNVQVPFSLLYDRNTTWKQVREFIDKNRLTETVTRKWQGIH
jgi:hypothetical protein